MTRDTVEQGPALFLPPSRWAVMPYSRKNQKDERQAVYFWDGAAWRVGQLIVTEELIADQEDGVRPLEYTVKPLVVDSAAAATVSLRARAMQREGHLWHAHAHRGGARGESEGGRRRDRVRVQYDAGRRRRARSPCPT